MSTKKLFTEWEKLVGVIIVCAARSTSQEAMTREQFDEYMFSHQFVGVDHELRAQFLRSRGLETSRENMINTAI